MKRKLEVLKGDVKLGDVKLEVFEIASCSSSSTISSSSSSIYDLFGWFLKVPTNNKETPHGCKWNGCKQR